MFLPSGINVLDDLLGGGLTAGWFTQIYGEGASGKTTLGHIFTRAAREHGWETIIINTEYGSPIERLEQVTATPFERMRNSIRIIIPKTFEEQGEIIEDLELFLRDSTRLIVVDTLTKLYRVNLKDKEKNYVVHRELNRQAGLLKGLAVHHRLFLLVLNQVRGNIGSPKESFEPVARNIMEYWSDCTLKIEHGKRTGERIIQRADQQGSSKSCRLYLTSDGFVVEPVV